MANETTTQDLYIQENPDADECRENIPPGGAVEAGASKLKLPHDDNKPLSDSCTFSTPALTSGKSKPRISGFQPPLTPILKYLNTVNKCPSPQLSKHEGNQPLTVPLFPFGFSAANSQKSGTGFSSCYSGKSLSGVDGPVSFLGDEYLPEITLLDSTCDSIMQLTRNDSLIPDSVPSTPAPISAKDNISEVHPSELSKHIVTMDNTDLNTKMVDPSQSKHAPVPWLILDRFLPEITLLDATCDSESSPGGQTFSMDETQDLPPLDSLKIDRPLSELSGKTVAEPDSVDTISGDELSSTSVQSDRCVGENIMKTSSEVTQDITKESVLERSSSEPTGQNIGNSQTSTENTLENSPANVTDKTISSDMSAHSTQSCVYTMECSTSLKNATLELCEQPVETFDMVEANSENHETNLSGSRQNMEKSRTSNENNSANITREIISSDMAAQPAQSCVETMECCTSPKNVTLELSEEPVESSDMVEANNEELLTNPETNLTSKCNGQNMEKSRTSAEETLGSQPSNITHDIDSSGGTSAQSVNFSSTSPKKVTSELHGELLESSDRVDANNEDTKLKNKVPQPSPKTAQSANGTFNVVQATSMNVSTDLNAIASVSCPENKTLDVPPFNENSPRSGTGATDQKGSGPSETSVVTSQNCSAAKQCGPCDVQNATFERYSVQKSSDSRIVGEAAAATLDLKNNTFDSKPPSKQNSTITLSETRQSESHQNTSKTNGTVTLSETSSCDGQPNSSDKLSTPKACNLTTTLKDNNSEVDPKLSKCNVTADATDHIAKLVETPNNTSGAGRCETKDHSGLPVMDGLSDSLNRQSIGTVSNKAKTFNLDDTLDLKADSLITSTPMTNCKIFSFNTDRDEGKVLGAQKKLYTDDPSKPAYQVSSDVPPNLVCDRKTFLKQPAAKSICPPLKAAAQMLKSKPVSSIPGWLDVVVSGLPVKRQRTQAEASKKVAAAASDAHQGTTGVTSAYNLRPTTTGSKLPSCGLQRPQLSGIPSTMQRTVPGLRPPSTRSNTAASSSSDRLCGPTATNPMTKTSQAKKHPLTKGEALPVSKRKKIDASVPSSSAEAPVSTCDTTNKAKNLKQPSQRAVPAKSQKEEAAVTAHTTETSTSCNAASRARALKQPGISHKALPPKTQGHGCAKCAVLEEQLKMKSDENRRLKEELLKYTKQDEDGPVKSQC